MREPGWRWGRSWARVSSGQSPPWPDHWGLWHANRIFQLYFKARGWSFAALSLSVLGHPSWSGSSVKDESAETVTGVSCAIHRRGATGSPSGKGALGEASMPSTYTRRGKCQRVISARREWTLSDMRLCDYFRLGGHETRGRFRFCRTWGLKFGEGCLLK